VVVDAHAHVWVIDPISYPWQPTFGFVPDEAATPDDLLLAMDRHDVAFGLLVQPSAYGPDHRFLLDTVRAHSARFLPIGLVDPADPSSTDAAESLVRDEGCVGLRVNLSLDVARAEEQANGSSWDLLESLDVPISLRAGAAHHALVKRILTRHRALRLVVDHLGLPEASHLDEAGERLAEIARFDQSRLKLAGFGLASRTGPPYRDTWPLVRSALRAFGPSRLVWGSDFPAGGVAAGYEGAVEAMESMPFLSAADRARIMGQTALELWGSPRPVSETAP
jgi:predicted TIM-barrel fold metal-dependent hydrolase